jgi:hypothetical protein
MLSISATNEWRIVHTGAAIGLLELSRIEKAPTPTRLDDRKRETEAHLRQRYQGLTRHNFSSLPVMSAYVRYYKRFGTTYHVQLQVESIVSEGKSLPSVACVARSSTGRMIGLRSRRRPPTSSMSPTLPLAFRQRRSMRSCGRSKRMCGSSLRQSSSSNIGCSRPNRAATPPCLPARSAPAPEGRGARA